MDIDYKHRLLEKKLLEAFEHFPVVLVLGARQVGKSTLISKTFGKKLKTIVLDPIQDIGQARQDPDLFLSNQSEPLFLDEVQYAPELLASIKRQVDRVGTPGQFVLSGSQNLSLTKGVSESLAGRAAVLHLSTLSYGEITSTPSPSFLYNWVGQQDPPEGLPAAASSAIPWYPAIWRGGYPGLLTLPDSMVGTFFSSYVTTYVERDIRTLAEIGDIQLFGRFLMLLAGLSSCEINHSQLGRELGLDHKTAKRWLSIAEASYQWIELPAFNRNTVKRVSARRKGYLTDTGMLCWQQRIPTPDLIAGHPLHGQIVETWIVNEIVKEKDSWDVPPNLYHYRSHGGAEVDLLLEWAGRLFPIEIKAKSHPRTQDGRGIGAFRQAHPQENIAPGLIVCAIREPRWISSDLYAVPWWML